MAEIQLIKVSKSWGDFNAVVDFNLTIKDKEFLVLLGPSGCGKCTFLRIVAGLETPDDGQILFDGHPVTETGPVGASCATQDFSVLPGICGIEEHMSHANNNGGTGRRDC